MARTLEERRQHMREYMQRIRQEEPDRNRRWRLSAAACLLRRNGYTVIAPEVKPE